MRLFLTLAILILFSQKSFEQTNIEIILQNTQGQKIEKVDAFDLSQKEFFETIYNDTLNFIFTKKHIDCYNIRFHGNGKIYSKQLWLDTGKLMIKAHFEKLELIIDTVINSPIYYNHRDFIQNYSRLYKMSDTIVLNAMLLDFFLVNIDNPYSFVFADNYVRLNQNSKSNLVRLKYLLDKQGDKFKWFVLYSSIAERVNKILDVTSIRFADFSFINKENKVVKIPPLTKKYYILDFWFLACKPCIGDHKEIFNALKSLDEKNAEIISISIDKDFDIWRKYLTTNKYNWLNFLESEKNKLTERLVITAFPTYIIIDHLGNILNTQNSFSDVLNWINKN